MSIFGNLSDLAHEIRSGAGFKVGRKWRATEEQAEQAIELLTAATGSLPAIPSGSSMTRTSRRRLAS